MRVRNNTLKISCFFLMGALFIAFCWPFLYNPLVFDDQNLFLPGQPQAMLEAGFQWVPRLWVNQTLAATFVLFEGSLFWLRMGNAFAHIATALVLYIFVRRLLMDLDVRPSRWLGVDGVSFLVAVLFVIHPLAVFAQAYLVQRTIIFSTLFLLLSLHFFWCGLRGSSLGLLLSCIFCAISLSAKEHAVMLPVCSLLLFLLHWRSSFELKISGWKVWLAIIIQFVIAFIVVLQLKGFIGQPYEMMLAEVLDDQVSIPDNYIYPLSFLNQAALFFKYGVMWVVPSPWWVSIDIRDPFPLSFISWSLWLGVFAFLGYLSAGLYFLLRGGLLGLLGFAILAPATLFATEFSVVRLQEPFVLYRSYLWAPFLFLICAMLLREMGRRILLVLIPVVVLFLLGLSFARLSTFAHPILVWSEAAELLERQGVTPGVFGAYRIYYNLGNQFFHEDMLDSALVNYERALGVKPDYAYAHYQRGVISLRREQWAAAQSDFQAAILEKPEEGNFYVALAEAFDGAGLTDDSVKAKALACKYGRVDKCIFK